MENELGVDSLLLTAGDGVEVLPTLVAFVFCITMAMLLKRFYLQYAVSLTGKSHISAILPVLSAVVFTVIVVVKSSLALSLGLVGALSIVRFRTPIKEPEELVYLFLAIAIGLGYGAGHIVITTLLITLTLAVVYLWLSNRTETGLNEYNLVVSWSDSAVSFEEILAQLSGMSEAVKLIRLDQNSTENMAVLQLVPGENFEFDRLSKAMQALDASSSTSFYEVNTNW